MHFLAWLKYKFSIKRVRRCMEDSQEKDIHTLVLQELEKNKYSLELLLLLGCSFSDSLIKFHL